MYVIDDFRRNGLSKIVLQALEEWRAELGYTMAILETGKGQPEAIGLYKKGCYEIIDNYGPYKNLENSVCMKKVIL
jgi:GNAT superfamily N-acetyltransferase